MIHLKAINKFYPAGFSRAYVLRNINLAVQEGEFISIMGPSGSGKTTLLNIFGMLEEPSSGEYFFLDKPRWQGNTFYVLRFYLRVTGIRLAG
jgi:putative ABC transport system ATP-binding protein